MLTKYQKVENTNVVSPEGHQAIEEGLNKVGKTSLGEASEAERRRILEELEEAE